VSMRAGRAEVVVATARLSSDESVLRPTAPQKSQDLAATRRLQVPRASPRRKNPPPVPVNTRVGFGLSVYSFWGLVGGLRVSMGVCRCWRRGSRRSFVEVLGNGGGRVGWGWMVWSVSG
jgi:hypothetical protein